MRGPGLYGVALRHYNECIDHASRIPTAGAGSAAGVDLLAAAWANIAAIHLTRKKYISCVEAAERALRLSHGRHAKAAFRAVKVSDRDVVVRPVLMHYRYWR